MLAVLGLVLLVFGLSDPMLLIAPMWIFTYLARNRLRRALNRLPLWLAFIGGGVIFGLAIEIMAIFDNLSVAPQDRILIDANPAFDLIFGFFYYAMLVGVWYLLLRKIRYAMPEVFILTGIFGIFTEEMGQILIGIFTLPITGLLYALIVAIIYGVFPMLALLLTQDRFAAAPLRAIKRWPLALLVIFVQWAVYGVLVLPALKLIFT